MHKDVANTFGPVELNTEFNSAEEQIYAKKLNYRAPPANASLYFTSRSSHPP